MDMVVHQAITAHSQSEFNAVLAEPFEVEPPIGIGKEYELLVIPSSRDVMPAAGHHHARHSCPRMSAD
jgi:hypothetical protein